MEEIILKVPLFNQPHDKAHCAVACMRMVMAYNGDFATHEELVKEFPEIDKTRIGITPATGRLLAEKGYDVFYSTHQEEPQWEEIRKFIEAGGKFSKQLSTLDDIDHYLKLGIPVRVGVKMSVFSSDPQNNFNHAVVIIGVKDDRYLINDPGAQFSEAYWVDKTKLLEAWHANGALMLVATKKR